MVLLILQVFLVLSPSTTIVIAATSMTLVLLQSLGSSRTIMQEQRICWYGQSLSKLYNPFWFAFWIVAGCSSLKKENMGFFLCIKGPRVFPNTGNQQRGHFAPFVSCFAVSPLLTFFRLDGNISLFHRIYQAGFLWNKQKHPCDGDAPSISS